MIYTDHLVDKAALPLTYCLVVTHLVIITTNDCTKICTFLTKWLKPTGKAMLHFSVYLL